MMTRKTCWARMGRYRLGGSSDTTQNQPLGPWAETARERGAEEIYAMTEWNPLRLYKDANPRQIAPLAVLQRAALNRTPYLGQPTTGLQNLLQMNAPLTEAAQKSALIGAASFNPVQNAIGHLGQSAGIPSHLMGLGSPMQFLNLAGFHTGLRPTNDGVLAPGQGTTTHLGGVPRA